MDRLDKILKARKLNGITWQQLAEDLPISGEGIRIAFSRKHLNEEYLEVIEKKLGFISSSDTKDLEKNDDKIKSVEDIIAKKVFLLLQPEIERIKTQLNELREDIRNLN